MKGEKALYMQYCTKCFNTCNDGLSSCPVCKHNEYLRPVTDTDKIILGKYRNFDAQNISELFNENNIVYEVKPFSLGFVSTIYDSEVMPDDKNIYVNYSDYDKARVIIGEYSKENDNKEIEEQETVDPKTQRKRIITEIISILAFLIIVSLVVFSSDAVANWLRDIFIK
jgi:hypothetical protein